METNIVYNNDCIKGLKSIPDESIDCILTDPPYLYLKNQKLDKPFDEELFFNECTRVLKKGGIMVMFGRGSSFYRWNTILASKGFDFKEEVVWNKNHNTSPVSAISRVHETISIHTKGNGKIYKAYVPYLEMKKYDFVSISNDIKRLRTLFKNADSFQLIQKFLEENKGKRPEDIKCEAITRPRENKHSVSIVLKRDLPREYTIVKSMEFGMVEKSIIQEPREHYKMVHPTQKPIKLLKRLLALSSKEGDIVLDPFAGSCSTALACMETNRQYICYEIDKEYFDIGTKRIEEAKTLFDR